MRRTQIYLTKVQIERLEVDSKKTGISKSELIRRILDKYFDRKGGQR